MNEHLKTKWIRPEETVKRREKLQILRNAKELKHLADCVLEILYNRGFDKVEKIESFLHMDITDIHNPQLMKDSDKAVSLLIHAIKNNLHIVVYGDYDCDGVSATSIAVLALRNLGAKVSYFVNNRFKHGYGMNVLGLEDMMKKYPDVDVVLTVDNGIVAYEGIKKAKELGLTVIVTDHHDPGDHLPEEADAVVNPKRHDCEYPFKGLCGASVIYKVMLQLYWELDKDIDYVQDMIDIVGIATVGDIMPLIDENRVFVTESIRQVKRAERHVFKVLQEKTGVKEITEETYGFKYVPMINALGRITGDVDEAIEMFVSQDEEKIPEIVAKVIETNEYRKKITEEQEELAIKMVEEKGVKPVIVIYHPSFHEGIVGLIAGRLKERYFRPVIVLAEGHGFIKGSARSIPNFHIKKAFDETREYLIGYGGHPMAGGLSLKEEHLEAFEEKICSLAESQLTESDFIPRIMVDTVVEPKDVTVDLVEELEVLKPFGEAFSKPNFGLKGFKVDSVYYMGENKNHLKLKEKKLEIIMFNRADIYQGMQEPRNIKALGYPALNIWNNKVTVQFNIEGTNIAGC